MSAQWLESSSEYLQRLSATLEAAWHVLAQPERARQLRRGLLLLLAVWAVFAGAQLIWAWLPTPESELPAKSTVLNPVSSGGAAQSSAAVDIDSLIAAHLFGEVGAQPQISEAEARAAEAAARSERDGIENGARETRLNLRLVGVVASTQDGLGHAIIEHKKKQAVYAVEDKLPVSGRVLLAKVMPTQVVLDNGGTYELLKLFDDDDLGSQLASSKPLAPPKPRSNVPVPTARAAPMPPQEVDKRDDHKASDLARNYRDRLYQNPQSLTEVVRVSAVREGGELRGYRIGPGNDAEQFKQLGFEQGDLVTGINGIALDNPANTMQLYQTMRSASEAVFEIDRGGQQISVSVSLGNP